MKRLIQKIKIWFIVNILAPFWKFLNNIRIKVATTEKEFDEIFFFRWKMYTEYGYIDPQDFPHQKLSDKYDRYSLNVIAYKNGQPVGTVRLILPSKEGFPTEKAFNIIDLNAPRKKMGEISKLCIKKESKKNNLTKKIFLCLMAEIYKLSQKNKIDYWLVGIPVNLKSYIEKLHFHLNFQQLKTGPLKPENIKERKTAKKYFEKQQIIPFLISIKI